MRSRSNSGIRLDYYYRIVNATILKNQHPITGLLPLSVENNHAWVRDNLYSVLSVWALSLAYRKTADVDEDRAKAYELEKTVVKLMRGILTCMLRQVLKVEKFKHTQHPRDALHAKYNSATHSTVVSDTAWGHLQIDATSLYLLTLAQMTTAGLQIIYTLDEVAFIQNLVFYVESAYRIPDYGIWERGDKTNHGQPELNASSIGMAKAAMEAMTALDLFGSNGGPLSVIHVQADKVAQCDAVLESMLPRESTSKEVDSALLSVIGFPAFAVDNADLIKITREKILNKLLGRYGCCRFLRDGFKTAIEDSHRLHYEPAELQRFENIECEWPIFYAYLAINERFEGNKDKANDYQQKLMDLLVMGPNGIKCVPEAYSVPADKVTAEYAEPKSQERVPVGQTPHKWGQSLYVISRLLEDGFISPGELDPLNRRFTVLPKPDLVVQVIMLAEDETVQRCLTETSVHLQTIEGFMRNSPYVIHPARVLSETLSHLGENSKLGLSGRFSGVGRLATSSLYRFRDNIYAFTPELYDATTFYLAMDLDFLFDQIRTDLSYLKANWQMLGRPTVVIPIYNWMADFSEKPPEEFVRILTKLKSGYLNGVRVELGNIEDFLSTSCITSLDWLHGLKDDSAVCRLENAATDSQYRARLPSGSKDLRSAGLENTEPKIHGMVKRMLSVTNPVQISLDTRGRSSLRSAPQEQDEHHLSSSMSAPIRIRRSTSPFGGHLRVAFSPKLPSSLPGSSTDFSAMHRAQDVVDLLISTESCSEQADIIHYLFVTYGRDWETNISPGETCTVNDLLNELYNKAGNMKNWWLIRYTAGMLRKKVATLASALSDLIVRRKQVSFGDPAQREITITQPMSPEELPLTIEKVCCEDWNQPEQYRAISPLCMLHQEILIYLAMFIRTNANLLHEMLRIRIGLIIRIMTLELSRCLQCEHEEATLHLLNLSPYELKNLLEHILSGKEFTVEQEERDGQMDKLFIVTSAIENDQTFRRMSSRISRKQLKPLLEGAAGDQKQVSIDNVQSHWARRRRIDGALNRVPVNFYSSIWKILTQCQGISIEGKILSQNLIKEMTEEELKFAHQVEAALNQVPEPEYRQLIVEALLSLSIYSELNKNSMFIDAIIPINHVVERAYKLSLHDNQNSNSGENTKHDCVERVRGICTTFYNTAPSGKYGTMVFMCKALNQILQELDPARINSDCTIS